MHRLCQENGIRLSACPATEPVSSGIKTDGGRRTKNCAQQPVSAPGLAIDRQGYPLLIDEGRILRDKGIAFHDLTMLFKELPDPIYVDGCCHYNQQGYDLLAAAVARGILEDLPAP